LTQRFIAGYRVADLIRNLFGKHFDPMTSADRIKPLESTSLGEV
jgi:hypothetical protein